MLKIVMALAVMLAALPALADDVYVGVGIVIEQHGKNVQVVEVFKGGPAERAGMQAGEIIVAVDGNRKIASKIKEVSNAIRGPEGTRVVVTVSDGNNHERSLEMIREKLVVHEECFIVGSVSLQTNAFNPGSPATMVIGSVGNKRVSGSITGGAAYVRIGNEAFNMTYASNGTSSYLGGWVHGVHVDWYGTGANFYGYQPCIK